MEYYFTFFIVHEFLLNLMISLNETDHWILFDPVCKPCLLIKELSPFTMRIISKVTDFFPSLCFFLFLPLLFFIFVSLLSLLDIFISSKFSLCRLYCLGLEYTCVFIGVLPWSSYISYFCKILFFIKYVIYFS